MPTGRTDQHVVRAAIRVARRRLRGRMLILSSTRRGHDAGHTATVAIRWGHIVFEPAPLRGALHVPLNEGPGDTLPIRSTGGLASSRAATDVEIMVVAARSIDIRLVAALGQSKLKRRCQQRRRQADPHGTHRDLSGLVTGSLNPLWCGVQRLWPIAGNGRSGQACLTLSAQRFYEAFTCKVKPCRAPSANHDYAAFVWDIQPWIPSGYWSQRTSR